MANDKVNVTIFGRGNRLTFGKYKGQLIEDIVVRDSDYLIWAHSNIAWFELDEELLDDILAQDGVSHKEPNKKEPASQKQTPKDTQAQAEFDDWLDNIDAPPF